MELGAVAALVALGAFHGLNPGMGWLFAVALGMQEGDRRAVLRALPPIALGHAAAVLVALAAFTALRTVIEPRLLGLVLGVGLIGFGAWKLIRRRHPRWVGMRVRPWELGLWSFIMAGAHGAGLMLLPVVAAVSIPEAHPVTGLAAAAVIPGSPSVTASAIHTAGDAGGDVGGGAGGLPLRRRHPAQGLGQPRPDVGGGAGGCGGGGSVHMSKPDSVTKSALIEAAEQVLHDVGFAGLSTRRVAETAGVPLSQIHYHFGSKSKLMLAVLLDQNRKLLDRQTEMYGEEVPLWKRYEQACDFLEDDLESGYVRILQEMTAAGWSDPAIAAVVRDQLEGWMRLLSDVAEQASEKLGGLGPFTPAELAWLIGLAFLGGETMILLGFRPDQVRESLRSVGRLIREFEEGAG